MAMPKKAAPKQVGPTGARGQQRGSAGGRGYSPAGDNIELWSDARGNLRALKIDGVPGSDRYKAWCARNAAKGFERTK